MTGSPSGENNIQLLSKRPAETLAVFLFWIMLRCPAASRAINPACFSWNNQLKNT